MSDKPVIKIIGIGDVGKRCIERNSSKSRGVYHLFLDRYASKDAIEEAVIGAEMLWIAADAADSNLVAEIGRATSDALTIALLKGASDPNIASSFEAYIDAYTFASSDDEFDDVSLSVSALSELVSGSGIVSLDIEDAKVIFHRAGNILIGSGEGKDVADAAMAAMTNIDMHKGHAIAERAVFRVDTDTDVGIQKKIRKAHDIIIEAFSPDALMLWGVICDTDLHDRAKVVIAAGFKPIS